MSVVNVLVLPDQLHMVTDTAAASADGRPLCFTSKVMFLPHVQALVGCTGSVFAQARLWRALNCGPYLPDVEAAAGRAAERIGGLLDEALAEPGAGGTPRRMKVTIAGPCPRRGRFVAFHLRDRTGFALERLGDGAHFDPGVFGVGTEAVRTVDDLVEATGQQIAGVRRLQAAGELPAGASGGELWCYSYQQDGLKVWQSDRVLEREALAARMTGGDHAGLPR